MITVTINGEERQLEQGTTVDALLTLMKAKRSFLAVERNREIVPRTAYAETTLADGDRVEIVTLVGGG
ncbi:MAG TPA: sulfur carrier protein ThiS [Acidobacteriota bacterium]|nr:sulfur carrier protein ThiS [Acidobacteriota bacterium]